MAITTKDLARRGESTTTVVATPPAGRAVISVNSSQPTRKRCLTPDSRRRATIPLLIPISRIKRLQEIQAHISERRRRQTSSIIHTHQHLRITPRTRCSLEPHADIHFTTLTVI